MLNILTINRVSSDNLGDQAIGKSLIEIIENNGCKAVSYDLLYVDEKERVILPKESGRGRTSLRIFKMLRNYRLISKRINKLKFSKVDVVLIGGGELLQDNNTFPIALYCWIKALRKHCPEAPVYLFGVGVTSNFTVLSKLIIKYILKDIRFVFVRDSKSQTNLKNVFNVGSFKIPDIVFGSRRLCSSINKHTKDNLALIGITSYKRIRFYNQNIADENIYFDIIFRKYLALFSYYKYVQIFYTNSEDYASALKFQKWCILEHNTEIEVANYKDLESFCRVLAKARYLSSPRMHACILGALFDVIVEPVLISNKMKSFSEEYNLDSINKEDLFNVINDAFCRIIKHRE